MPPRGWWTTPPVALLTIVVVWARGAAVLAALCCPGCRSLRSPPRCSAPDPSIPLDPRAGYVGDYLADLETDP